MAPLKPCQEICSTIAHLIADRNRLGTALAYAESTISELEFQNLQMEQLLFHAHSALQSNAQILNTAILPESSWIGGSWLSSPTVTPFLAEVESAWQSGLAQQALVKLTSILLRHDLMDYHRGEAELLFCAILRSSGNIQQALDHAEKSLEIARQSQLHNLIGKAQFHRGLCFLYLERYADARWCFVLASHTKGHRQIVMMNKKMAEQKLQNLSPEDPKGKVTLGLDQVTSAKGYIW